MQNNKKIMVKRFLYEKKFSPIQKNHVIISKCKNYFCVKPSHLKMISKNEQRKLTATSDQNGRLVRLTEVSTKKVFTFPSVKKAAQFLNGWGSEIHRNFVKRRPYKGYLIKY